MNTPSLWHDLQEQKRETWGAFVQHALRYGCELVTVPDEFIQDGCLVHETIMIRRFDAEVERLVRIPLLCTPDRLMRYRRFVYECRQLNIPVDQNWPVTI